jgi:hypothetical protein
VVDSAKAVEVSLAENTLRLAMHPADQFVAFSELVKDGQPVEEVAASLERILDRIYGPFNHCGIERPSAASQHWLALA